MEVGKDYIGVGCGAIVINDKDEVLLVKRSMNARTEPGTYSRPGGEVEFGETIAHAAERETWEETGVVVKVLEISDIPEVISKERHWLAFGCKAQYISGVPINREPKKHDEVGWYPLSNLPSPINEYTKSSIDKILRGRR